MQGERRLGGRLALKWGCIRRRCHNGGCHACLSPFFPLDTLRSVFDCSDPTECTPDFEFAPRRTFTIADAVRAAGANYTSHFGGKWCVWKGGCAGGSAQGERALGGAYWGARKPPWQMYYHANVQLRAGGGDHAAGGAHHHRQCTMVCSIVLVLNPSDASHLCRHLGSLYNDSEAFGGITNSPLTHGFDQMNATMEVAPTATTNCQCNEAWRGSCDFGHNEPTNHCTGSKGPDPLAPPGCCFNC